MFSEDDNKKILHTLSQTKQTLKTMTYTNFKI